MEGKGGKNGSHFLTWSITLLCVSIDGVPAASLPLVHGGRISAGAHSPDGEAGTVLVVTLCGV